MRLMRSKIILVAFGFLAGGVFGAPLAVQDDYPENSKPDAAMSYGAIFQVGVEAPLTITVMSGDGTNHAIRVKTDNQRGCPRSKLFKDYTVTNSVLRFSGAVNLAYYSRPRLIRYKDDQITERLEAWEQLPVSTARDVRMEIRPVSDGLEVWLDGRYAGRITAAGGIKSITFEGGNDAIVKDRTFFASSEDERFLPLEYGAVAQPGAMQTATASLKPGRQQIAGIPMIVSDGTHSGDIAEVKQMRGSWALECDDYLSRTSFDGMPESQLISVPQRFYHRAWVLFAVDPDPAKDPILTVRLTRFAGRTRMGRGGAIADTYLNLPRDGQAPDKNIQQVGTIKRNVEGKTIELPLYLASVEIPLGEIFDLISQEGQDPNTDLSIGPFLDFEILGRRGEIGVQWDGHHKPSGAPSAANIFGVTLEKSPVEMRLTQKQPGNVFYNDEVPQTDLTVQAQQAGRYTARWIIRDVDGKIVRKDEATFSLAAGQEATRTIDLAMPDLGYYALTLELVDASGVQFLSHEAAFALLGPDTRQAGYESPYGVWWYGGIGITARDIAIAGPLHLKAGIRKTISHHYTEAEMAPWKMTRSSFGWLFGAGDVTAEGVLSEAAQQRVAKNLDEGLVRHPHCDNVLIFHESHANTMPVEMAGLTQAYTPEEETKMREKAKLGNLAAEFYRKRYPQLKIVFGNSGGSARIVADLLRFGFKPAKIDRAGIESPSQTFMPESISEHNILSTWVVRAIGRHYGYELLLTGCHEFTYRLSRVLGKPKQAEYYVRDILLSHAFGFDHIAPGTLSDPGASYYNSGYGGNGLLERYPLLYPKPSYVAVATATRVLDKATCTRIVPTGSLTVYALEFARARKQRDFAYGIWTPRGLAGLKFTFGEAVKAEVVDLYGRSRHVTTGADHSFTVEAGPAAAYVIVDKPITSISIASRDFSSDAPPATFKPADTMADINTWSLVTDYSLSSSYAKRGKFEMRGVTDPERGPCMELELKPDTALPPLVAEYTVLRLRKPIPLIGEPHTIGVWVKGNSNWGRLFFEVMDADGRLWRCDGGYNDWPADLAVNFDGWRFLKFFIDEKRSSVRNLSPGNQWRSNGGGTQPKYPLKLNALYVTMHRQALDPVEMREVKPVLRFQNIGAY